MPQTIVALAPTDAPRRTNVRDSSHPPVARGLRSFVNTADGPTNASSSSSTPAYTDTLFWIFTRSPTRTPVSTNTLEVSIRADDRASAHVHPAPQPCTGTDGGAILDLGARMYERPGIDTGRRHLPAFAGRI